jgi:predicted phosphodiesterase
MSAPTCGNKEFVELFEQFGAAETARRLKIDVRKIYTRRVTLEKQLGRQITGPIRQAATRHYIEHPQRIHLECPNGTILVASDCHYWPGLVTTAHRAFLKFCKELNPKIVILNGDVLDGASVSRHPPINWEEQPTLIQEIEACQERLGEIESAAGKAKRIWTLGNHDARFETRLATVAPEYAKVHGMHLKDHFPPWEAAMSTWINDDLVVKHRYKNGVHAPWNNTIYAGKSMFTGHLHSAKVYPFTDYNGTRYGVDGGTMAEAYGPQFEYTEDNPVNWRSAFIVAEYWKGELLWPQIAHVMRPGLIEFERKVIEV